MIIWLVAVLIAFLIGLVIIFISNSVIRTRNIIIENNKIEKNTTIVFVSDIHVGKHNKRKELEKIIGLINDFGGDYLFVGGDMIGRRALKYYNDLELKEIIDSLKIKKRFFVRGNHDNLGLSMYEKFIVLKDRVVDLGNNVVLVGLDWKKGECLDYKLSRDNFNILLAHHPDRVMEYSKIDLALGGHSHGKQINVPFLKFSSHKEKYVRGLYSFSNNKHLYVNRGLGFSILKIRVFSCREIVRIELRKCE